MKTLRFLLNLSLYVVIFKIRNSTVELEYSNYINYLTH
jgi:hypothetical protein